MERMMDDLASIKLALRVGPEEAEKISKEILEAMSSFKLYPDRRAEGYAFIPSRQAAVAGLPHLRLAYREGFLIAWVRAPYSMRRELCEMLGLKPETLYQELLGAAKRIASILEKHGIEGENLMISLPERVKKREV